MSIHHWMNSRNWKDNINCRTQLRKLNCMRKFNFIKIKLNRIHLVTCYSWLEFKLYYNNHRFWRKKFQGFFWWEILNEGFSWKSELIGYFHIRNLKTEEQRNPSTNSNNFATQNEKKSFLAGMENWPANF